MPEATAPATSGATPPDLTRKYLAGYPDHLTAQVASLVAQGRLGDWLQQRHPDSHEVRTDKALYTYVAEMKARYLRSAEPLSKVLYDNRLRVWQHALGTHTAVSRVQGNRLKAKREIRVDSLFKDAPANFLKMIVVHELAHLKEREHNRAFYQLCAHMAPDYAQLEFDLRLYLIQRELSPAEPTPAPAAGAA